MPRILTPEHLAAMKAGRRTAKSTPKEPKTPLEAIRAHCLQCCESRLIVKFCTCDGLNSTKCPLWPFRFGKRPSTMKKGPDAYLLDPKKMPPADVPQENCEEWLANDQNP